MREDPAEAFPGERQHKPEPAEFTRLQREVARLKMERDILKGRYLSGYGVEVRFGFVGQQHSTPRQR